MKLLLATYKNKWEKDILRSFYYLINILKDKYGYTLIDLSDYPLNSDFNDIINKFHNVTSILVIENHNEILIHHIFPDFFNNSTKKYLFADDIHKFYDIKKNNYYEKFDKIFVTYYNPFIKLYPHIEKSRIIWCPHGFTEDYLLEFNKNPVNKILLSGAVGLLYPLRKYMVKLQRSELQDKINYLKHPGYKLFDYDNHKLKIGKSYSKLLNSHICCFTDCLTYGYIVSKYFEIPATGSLLLAQNPQDDKLENIGFQDGINYIQCDQNNIKEKINWVLDPKNKNKVDEIRKNGMMLVRSQHSISHRAVLINDHIDQIKN